MFPPPPIPPWAGFHPLVVHFPVALLITVPIFILAGIIFMKARRCWLYCGLFLMALGTAATYVAVPSGEAAARLAEKTPEIMVQIESHQGLAEDSRLFFTALTVAFALLLFLPRLFKRELKGAFGVALLLIFMAVYMAGVLMLANTAHAGGRLVHEFGVHSLI